MARLLVGLPALHGTLASYAKRYDLLELRPVDESVPGPARLRKWREQVGPTFAFSVVLPRVLGELGTGADAEWKLAGTKPGEKLDVSRANAASYSLQLLELADVAAKDAPGTGLDKAVAVDATTLEGASYAIKVGKLAGDNYYVTFSASGIKPDAKDAERAKLQSQHVLLIPKSKLEDTLRKRSDLLQKNEDKK